MQIVLLLMSFLCLQDSPATPPAAAVAASSVKPVRVEASMYCFRSNIEISQQQQVNIAEFLSDPKVQSQKFWSNEFSSTTLSGSELNISLGESRSVVSGVNVGANGRTTPTLVRQQVGTMMKVTPKLSDDGRIQAKFSIEASRVDDVDPDAELTEQMLQTGITQLQHSSSFLATSGKPEVIVVTQDNATSPEKSRKYLIVVKLTTLE